MPIKFEKYFKKYITRTIFINDRKISHMLLSAKDEFMLKTPVYIVYGMLLKEEIYWVMERQRSMLLHEHISFKSIKTKGLEATEHFYNKSQSREFKKNLGISQDNQ